MKFKYLMSIFHEAVLITRKRLSKIQQNNCRNVGLKIENRKEILLTDHGDEILKIYFNVAKKII